MKHTLDFSHSRSKEDGVLYTNFHLPLIEGCPWGLHPSQPDVQQGRHWVQKKPSGKEMQIRQLDVSDSMA